ncbi:cobalamin biosynthesis protein [Gordonia sp. CPCC 205515]|uniref:cobalamin biosynthesis protein n=1 Tax=Gordonia sp. CPCC 205515 TaxID=3140791 RepID=UPI003AF3C9DB
MRRSHRPASVAAGLLLGYTADRLLGDPRRWHPVAGLGRAIGVVEQLTYRDSRSAGTVFALGCVGAAAAAGVLATRLPGTAVVGVTAVTTWSVLGGTTLTRVGLAVADDLDADDIIAARRLVPSLCGRDPEALDAAGIARAAVESVAENTSDATVAPLFWGAIAGVPGLIAYRTINTMDAMVGYRNERYGRFGWAAARLDDVANLLPARLTGLLVAALGGAPGRSVAAWRADARRHPSPNAGVVEASFAGALGVTLGGRTEYRHGVEERPTLGSGPAPGAGDVRAAATLSRRVQLAAAIGAAGLAGTRAAVSRRSVG